MKVLIIRFSSIGDIVLTTPIVRCVKQQIPNCEVHFLTKSFFSPVIAANPHIDKLHLLENDLSALIEDLKNEQFDYVIDLHHNLRTKRVKRALKVPAFVFNKLNVKKWLLVNFKINLMPDSSIVERYFETVSTLGVKNDGKGLDYYIDEKYKITNQDLPMSHWAGYVGCVIGGSYPTKQFPIEKWKALIELIPYPVILLGGPDDKAAGDMIAEIDPIRVYNSCGKFNLSESALLVKQARLIVTNDTGLMHIAAAFQKQIISIWGNTSPEMGMFPYFGNNNINSNPSDKNHIFENTKLGCHPCSKLGHKKCPKSHFRCMNEINLTEMAVLVKKIWH